MGGSYKKGLNDRWAQRFNTRHPDGVQFDGVVTHVAKDFIVLCEIVDFEFYGVSALSKKFIKSIRNGIFDQCKNQIIRQNKELDKCITPNWINSCNTIPELMTEIMNRDIWPGVGTIFAEGRKCAFYLGPILEVEKDYFILRCYDAAGKWEKPHEIDFDSVFELVISSRYSRHFNHYMRSISIEGAQ